MAKKGAKILKIREMMGEIGYMVVENVGIEQFFDELRAYQMGKGTLSFSFDKPLPLELIRKVVKFRKEENLAKKKQKG